MKIMATIELRESDKKRATNLNRKNKYFLYYHAINECVTCFYFVEKNDGNTRTKNGKEAFLKAWCDYLGDAPYPFTLDNFPWPEIEILDDSRGVPHVSLGKGAASVFQTDYANSAAGARYSSAYSSASDNGPYAVMQERRNARSAQRSTIGAGSMPHIHISLSHDGSIASAVVTISVE